MFFMFIVDCVHNRSRGGVGDSKFAGSLNLMEQAYEND